VSRGSGPARRSGPPAIVLGGSSNAVSVARSLGSTGVRVHALGGATKPVRWCRHVHEFAAIDGDDPQGRMLEWLEHGPREGVLLPCDDEALELVARHRAELAGLGYVPPESDDAVVLSMLDKRKTAAIARGLGIDTPASVVVRDPRELDAADAGLAFPCAVKPVQSHVFARHFPGVKALAARDAAEARRHVERAAAIGVEMLLTEVIPGPESAFCSYYSYLDEAGAPLFHFTRHKLRQYPPGFGVTCYATNDAQPDAAATGLRFFQGAGLRGLGLVEFKRDARDGRLKLIECNPRFSAADRHLRLCGLDLPLFVYNRLLDRPLPPMETLRHGVRLWHPVQDVRAFRSERRLGTTTARRWLRSLAHRQHFPVADPRDPMPTIGYHAHALVRAVRRGLA
jgi:predicted ATP-grasp superfamily ATP-dependent carboligase